jgi:hypothetical protein
MARVSLTETPDLTIIRVVGRLGGDAVRRLRAMCRGARHPLVLHLSGVTDASEPGVRLLGLLASHGVHVMGASREIGRRLEIQKTAIAAPHQATGRPAS